MNISPTVSIITVVYNGEETLESTIKSIASQTYSRIEYIVIDGNSKDRTLEIVKKYSSVINKWISENDNGIYDAMNKGLQMATGDYVWFMNSGDEIYNSSTLERIFSMIPNSDIYYGDTIMINDVGEIIGNRRLSPPENLTWKSFKKGMLVSHQSFIAKRNITTLYNTKYNYSADFEWCLNALKKSHNICNTGEILSKFLDGGFTKQNIIPGLKERFKIMTRYYGLFSTLYHHIFIAFKFVVFLIKHKRF